MSNAYVAAVRDQPLTVERGDHPVERHELALELDVFRIGKTAERRRLDANPLVELVLLDRARRYLGHHNVLDPHGPNGSTNSRSVEGRIRGVQDSCRPSRGRDTSA